jgi:hypothetical protein
LSVKFSQAGVDALDDAAGRLGLSRSEALREAAAAWCGAVLEGTAVPTGVLSALRARAVKAEHRTLVQRERFVDLLIEVAEKARAL